MAKRVERLEFQMLYAPHLLEDSVEKPLCVLSTSRITLTSHLPPKVSNTRVLYEHKFACFELCGCAPR